MDKIIEKKKGIARAFTLKALPYWLGSAVAVLLIVLLARSSNGAMAALKQADRRAKAQQEAYAINSKKFEQGLISPLELKTSSDNHLNAQAEHLNAQLKYFIKSCVVRYYNGTPYLEQL